MSYDEEMAAPHLGPVEGMGFDSSVDEESGEEKISAEPECRVWKEGDHVHMAIVGHGHNGKTQVGAVVHLPALIRAVKAKLSKAGYGKMSEVYAEKVAKFVAAAKLRNEAQERFHRAANMNPVDFVMGEDYAKDAVAAVPLALDVISIFYPEAGVAMKLVNASNNGNPKAQQAIQVTAQQAQGGNAQAINAMAQLEQAAMNLGKLQKAVQSGQAQGPSKDSPKVEVSYGLYERGMGQ